MDRVALRSARNCPPVRRLGKKLERHFGRTCGLDGAMWLVAWPRTLKGLNPSETSRIWNTVCVPIGQRFAIRSFDKGPSGAILAFCRDPVIYTLFICSAFGHLENQVKQECSKMR